MLKSETIITKGNRKTHLRFTAQTIVIKIFIIKIYGYIIPNICGSAKMFGEIKGAKFAINKIRAKNAVTKRAIFVKNDFIYLVKLLNHSILINYI